jgi:hypothetical protein
LDLGLLKDREPSAKRLAERLDAPGLRGESLHTVRTQLN